MTPPAGLTLRLDASALPAGQFIEVRTASGAWDEATLTWANAPGSGPVVARQAVPVSGWVDIPLPSGLLSGDGTVDLVLTSTSTTQTTMSGSFYERNSLMPRLVVTK